MWTIFVLRRRESERAADDDDDNDVDAADQGQMRVTLTWIMRPPACLPACPACRIVCRGTQHTRCS